MTIVYGGFLSDCKLPRCSQALAGGDCSCFCHVVRVEASMATGVLMDRHSSDLHISLHVRWGWVSWAT